MLQVWIKQDAGPSHMLIINGNTDLMRLLEVVDMEHVTSLVAQHDMLATIRAQFSGIRMHNGTCVCWSGADARFIVENLDLETNNETQ